MRSGAQSPIAKTDAIVLRVVPYSETSLIVTWLTPDHARIGTMVKGAQRPKSPFLGQIDLFYTCELLFYERTRGDLHITKECCVLDPRPGLRANWRAAVCASYCCDLISRLSFGHHEEQALFGLLTAALDSFATDGGSLQVVFWFELHLARCLGATPRLGSCVVCRRPASGVAASFWVKQGGLVCPRCRPTVPGPADDVLHLTPDILAILRGWLQAKSPRAAARTRCSRAQRDHLRRLLGLFYNYHLDINPISRYKAVDVLEAMPK